jgi:hypothetical protein
MNEEKIIKINNNKYNLMKPAKMPLKFSLLGEK